MRHSTHLTKCKLAKAIIPEIPTQSWRWERGGVQKKGTRSHKITERACESGMRVSETGCCQMGLPREVQLRFDHRDEGGHSKQGGTAASSQVLSLPELFLRSVPLNLQGVCWNILSLRLSRIKNCGKFLKQLTSIAGKHRRQLEKSSWNWKEQHPPQRPECEQSTRSVEG